MSARRWVMLTLIGMALGCGACADSAQSLRRRLESFDPAVRVRAVMIVAEKGLTSLIPALVDRLDDEDSAVRLYTILALEKLTGQRLGYAYAAPRVQRRAAIENWRRYVHDSVRTSPADADPVRETTSDGAEPADSKPKVSPAAAIAHAG